MCLSKNELEETKECYKCCRENLICKTNELEEAHHIIDSMQYKIINLESELSSYKNGNVDHSKMFTIYCF